MKMAMAKQPEVHLLLDALQATKKSDSAWLINQAPPRDGAFVRTFRRKLYTDDSVSSEPNELFNLPEYYSSSDTRHLYTNNTLRSIPGPIKDHIQWQNRKSDTGCSVSSYKINDLEEAVLSTNGVSMSVPPTEERTALEAETSRQRSQHININGQLQFSSSDKAGNIASTGPCRSGLVDANCNGVSTGRLAPSRVDLNGALQHSHALVGTGGIKKSKKRSRASRRPPTTILEADSANFRSMVQQLTGFPSSPFLSDLLPRRGSQLLGFDARSQVRPSHGLGGQNISGIFADMPAFHSFRQPLIPKALNNCIYGDILSRTEAPSIRHVHGERDPSISFDVKPTTMGIADGSSLTDVLVNHSCSMSQKQSLQYSDMASLFSGIPSTRSTPSAESCINTPAVREGKGSHNLKEFSVDQVSKFLFDSHDYGNGKDLQSFPMAECFQPQKETDPRSSILEYNEGANFFPTYAIEKLVPSLGN